MTDSESADRQRSDRPHRRFGIGDDAELADHLMAGCTQCLAQVSELHAASGKAIPAEEARKNPEPGDYGDALEASIQASLSARRSIHLERSQVPQLLEELDRFPPERRQIVVCNSKRFRSLALCESLLEASKALWFSSAAGARERAELAVAVAETLEAGLHDGSVISDVRARAWAYLANAHKILSDFESANRCFVNAQEHLLQGTGSPTEEARVFELKAALLLGQRRFREADGLADKVLALYSQIGDTHSQGRVLIRKGLTRIYAGDHATAIGLLGQGLQLVNAQLEPRLELIGKQNLALSLVEADRLEEARKLIDGLRPLLEAAEDHLSLVRLRWTEGRIALKEDRLEEAEGLFLEVFNDFKSREIGYDAALVSLDLAEVYAEQGRNRELQRLALSLTPIFRSRQVHREALTALLMFQQSAEKEVVTRTLLRRIAKFVEEVRSDAAKPSRARGELLIDD